jgi:Immunity protein 26
MLTNSIREYYQIKPIKSDWKEVVLKNGYGSKVLIDKKNVLHKFIIDNSDKDTISYREIDYNVQLTNDFKIIGKTGKSKGLSYSVLEKLKPANKYFSVSSNSIDLYNFDNNINVLFDYNLKFKSAKEVTKYIESRIKNITLFEKEEFEKYISTKKQKRQAIKSGDIFRIKLNNRQFAYGRVIFDLDKFRNYKPAFISELNVGFRDSLIFDKVLMTPSLIDFYLIKTDNPYLRTEDFNTLKTTPSLIKNSELIKNNTFHIIGNTAIDLASFDIPMDWETYYQYKPISNIFKWGAGIKTFEPVKKLEKLTELTYPMNYNPINLRAIEEFDGFLTSCLSGTPNFKYVSSNGDLREPMFSEVRKIISKNINFNVDTNEYDKFAKEFGFMTKAEILLFTQS